MGSVGVRRDLGLVEEVGDVAVEVEHEGGASHVRLCEGNADIMVNKDAVPKSVISKLK